MFAGKEDHGLIKNADVVDTAFFSAFPFVMDDAGIGQVMVAKTTLLDAVGKVDVFAVHKKLLVQQAYLVQRCFAHEHKSPRKDIYLVVFIFGKKPQVITIEQA